MKLAGLFLLALSMQGCYHSYYKDSDSEWSYFEDWDLNRDLVVDKNEFTEGFLKDKVFGKLSTRLQPVNYEDFDSLVMRMAKQSGDKPEEKARAVSFDPDSDHKISEQESAAAMFIIADDNADNQLSSLEFYDWEVYL